MTSQIQSGSHQPKDTPNSPHFIPNSQSDDEIIQDFTLGDSGAASKQSPPTTVILPVNSSSMGPAPPAAESREPGWSVDKFHDTTSSTSNPSTHLKPNQPDSSSSSKQTPLPPILQNLSSKSNSNSSRPKPRPPRLGAASIEQARERLKLAQSADSPASSTTTDQSLPHPFDLTRTKSKPSAVVPAQVEATSQKVSEHAPAHDVETLPTGQSLRTSNKLTLPPPPETSIHSNLNPPIQKESLDAQPDSSKRKRKTKVQQVAETDLRLGPEKPSAKSDNSGKRVRKQSAAGKASAKSLQILLNLSQSSNDSADARLKPKESVIREESQTTRRRRVYRDGWVLASDPDPEPVQDASCQVPVTTKNQVAGSAHQSPDKNPVPHQAPVPNEISSHPFLEIISSPLSSPSGFSADEMNIKASKRSKTSPVPKKRAPKKKVTPKAKGKAAKNRKKTAADTESNASAVVIEEPHVESPADKTNRNSRQQNNPSPELRLQVPEEEAPKSPSQLSTHSRLRQSPRHRPERSNHAVSAANTRVATERIADANKASSPSNSRKAGPSATSPVQTSTKAATNQSGKAETGKKVPIKVKKGMSLAEILAMTNPKTKRGMRIGLPREEKHRLHININPNPPVQKQVKKKLKVKRGEYDSGEDDAPSKNSASESEDGQNGLNAKKSSQSRKRVPVDDEELDEDQDVQDNVEVDEEY